MVRQSILGCHALVFAWRVLTWADSWTAQGVIQNAGAPYPLMGVESADQCFCDVTKNPSYPEGNKRAPETECAQRSSPEPPPGGS